MRYEVSQRGHRLEAVGTFHGYRIRVSTLEDCPAGNWPVSAHVRGSESEAEVSVDVPRRHLGSAAEALEHGYDSAELWIRAEDHKGYL